jgi:tetratricopeptide (TPR) repeat protein
LQNAQELREEEEKRERERAEKLASETEMQRRANLTADSFKDDPKGLSEWYKERGNVFYKSKNFDQAIDLYTKVILDNDISILVRPSDQ